MNSKELIFQKKMVILRFLKMLLKGLKCQTLKRRPIWLQFNKKMTLAFRKKKSHPFIQLCAALNKSKEMEKRAMQLLTSFYIKTLFCLKK